eukprot:GFKZ01002740.1.p1 GENE.GFKZ01002740.1~~GFKZ01002740.1.p1  ORF type:complete len:517 (+),score=75.50 GFKZ01002740.1:132-1553(+)
MHSPPLPEGVAEAISYAASHGIIVGQTKTDPIGTALSHAPMTFQPSPLHQASYNHGLRIATPLSSLCARIAANPKYLRDQLAETAEADQEFTGRLLDLMPERPAGAVELNIFRFDFFVHDEAGEKSLRMVEMNCIASSFACLGTKTGQMHRYLATHPKCPALDVKQLPENDAMGGLAKGIATAWKQYRKVYGDGSRVVVVMVVQPGEKNAYDQDLLRITVWEAWGVEMVRMSLAEIAGRGTVVDGRLKVSLREGSKENVEVGVVYYRAGYTPDDYPSEKEWEARALIERSAAAKCPSVAMQLVGTKKIQQVLDLEGEVEKFLGEKDATEIRKTFVRQYSLSKGEETDRIVTMALENPDDFVLKPQREGGGNNLYSMELKQALETMSEDERAAYVLMERIRPVVVSNVLIRGGKFSVTDIVSEFGVYGVHITKDGEEVANYVGGTLLRSKAASDEDGGVAAGVAVLDSPMLVQS